MHNLPSTIDINPELDGLIDPWLAILGFTEFLLVTYLFRAAATSPDGLVDQSIEEIAEGTGLSWRTVRNHLQDLDTRGVIEVLSQEKECTLVRIPSCTGYLGLPPFLRRRPARG